MSARKAGLDHASAFHPQRREDHGRRHDALRCGHRPGARGSLAVRFGGAPTHYQLVEDEDAAGRPRVRLLVHPAVGILDPVAVAEAFLTAVGSGAGSDRVAELVWRDGRVLEVERSAPLATSGGKISTSWTAGRRAPV